MLEVNSRDDPKKKHWYDVGWKYFYIVAYVKSYITHILPLAPFYTPWKYQKTCGV